MTQATQVVFWPGQKSYACDLHAEKLKRLGSFLGFSVESVPVGQEIHPCGNCESEARRG